MSFFTLIITAVALSMDAFAISISVSLAGYCEDIKSKFIIPFSFGFFQMIMPILGYFTASLFAKQIMALDHYIAFILLAFIGVKMIIEASDSNSAEENKKYKDMTISKLITFSIATSIDALAAGISFAFLNINIFTSSTIIGIITFMLCFIGIKFGRYLGEKFKTSAELLGGLILIIIGLKILIEHLINGI